MSFSMAAVRTCSKTGCPALAEVTVALSYGDREVVLVDLLDERDPNLLELCIAHADALSPPVGWRLTDRRAKHVSSG